MGTLSYGRNDARPDDAGGPGHDTVMTGGPAVIRSCARSSARTATSRRGTERAVRADRRALYQIQGVASFYPHFRLARRRTRSTCASAMIFLPSPRRRRALAETRSARRARRRPAPSSARLLSRAGATARPRAVNDVIVTRVTADSLMAVDRRRGRGDPAAWRGGVRDRAAGRRSLRVRRALRRRPSSWPPPADADGAHRDAQGERPARPGRRRLPDRHEVGDWSATQPGPEKYIVCNADESEPGTIKDRYIMTNGAAPASSRG